MFGLFEKINGERTIHYTDWQRANLQKIKDLAVDYTFAPELMPPQARDLAEYLWGDPAYTVETIDYNKTVRDYPTILYKNEVTGIQYLCGIEAFRSMHMGICMGFRDRLAPKYFLDTLEEMTNFWSVIDKAKGLFDERKIYFYPFYNKVTKGLSLDFSFDSPKNYSFTSRTKWSTKVLAQIHVTNNLYWHPKLKWDYQTGDINGMIWITETFQDREDLYPVTDYRSAGELGFLLGLYLLCNPKEYDRALKLSQKFPELYKKGIQV